MSRAVNAQKNNFQYDRTRPTTIIPSYTFCRSQYNKLVVCYPCFCKKFIIKMDPLKKRCADHVLNPVLPGESRLLYHDAMMPLVPQGSTIVSYYSFLHYVIISLYSITSSCRERELKTMLFSFLRCKTDSKMSVKENV